MRINSTQAIKSPGNPLSRRGMFLALLIIGLSMKRDKRRLP